MAHHYFHHAFTANVRAQQDRDGSREHYARAGESGSEEARLGASERDFIAKADHFYQATVGETGWPYVQHRGGPVGFLKVLDEQTIAFADLPGNRQFISVGNLRGNDKMSIIIMDYVNKRRLKLMGWVEVRPMASDPGLATFLLDGNTTALNGRIFVIRVAGFDWNCPQHIVQRYTKEAVDKAMNKLRDEIARLRAQVRPAPEQVLDSGALHLCITGMRQRSPSVRSFQLDSADGQALPAIAPGATLAVTTMSNEGEQVLRHYSLMTADDGQSWEIAVQREEGGRGGSQWLHANWQLGQFIRCEAPTNHFPLHQDSRPALLLAAGIGITPLRAMAQALSKDGRAYQLHYTARGRADAAYLQELRTLAGDALVFHDTATDGRPDIDAIVAAAAPTGVMYACGPTPFLTAVQQAAERHGRSLVIEHFAAQTPSQAARPVTVKLVRSGKVLQVDAGTTLLDAIESAGVACASSCRTGQCGSCVTRVLKGQPEHLDHFLTNEEKAACNKMCVCVSRAQGEHLELDL